MSKSNHQRYCLCDSCSGVNTHTVKAKQIMQCCLMCGTPDGLTDQVHDLCVAVLALRGNQPVDTQETVQETINFAKEFIRHGVRQHERQGLYGSVK